MEFYFKNPQNNKYTKATPRALEDYLGKGQISVYIKFDKDIVSLTEVSRFLSFYKKMLELVPEKGRSSITGNLDFYLFNRIKNFDITFIAAINLFKLSFENITVRLSFDRLVPSSEEEACFYRFSQFRTTGILAYGKEIFGIVNNGNPVNPNLDSLSGYIPFIYVNENNFDTLFQVSFNETWNQWWDRLKPESIIGLKEKSGQAEKTYQMLREKVIESMNPKINTVEQGDSINLDHYILYLLNAVREFHFIKKVLKNQSQRPVWVEAGISLSDEDSPLGIGLSREADREYENKATYIFNRILEKPPAFIMLFSYFIEAFYKKQIDIYKKKLNTNDSYSKKIEQRIDLIANVFYFADEIFTGIRELAKNIIEHSSNRRGFILGRGIERKFLSPLKEGTTIAEFLESRPANEEEFIDFIVLDDGNCGIIDQTIKNLENLKEAFKEFSGDVEKFNEDIHNLKNGEIILNDFFNPDEIKLKYQEIRSALSLGLLIFSHLVLQNNGYMKVSSPCNDIMQGMAFFNQWNERHELKNVFPLGTFYNIIFPKNLKRPPVHRSETIPFVIPSTESAFTTSLKHIKYCTGPYNMPDSLQTDLAQNDKLCFIECQFNQKHPDMENILNQLKECDLCAAKKNKKILSLDLKNAPRLDQSDLFRSLSKIQMIKDIKSIIVHGVKEEIVSRTIEFFKIFKEMKRKIGSPDHFVLFYYQPSGQRQKYYSFLLGGDRWEDMCWINERIGRTGYIQPGIRPDKENNPGNPSEKFQKDYLSNPLFTNEGHLLPFDILIKSRGLTLFEQNVLGILIEPGMHRSSLTYTFKDAHIRLGSKIHIRDFFYARRIFQNSFYSLRFAYLVCRYIQDNVGNWGLNPDENDFKLTILGYGLYSELLISNVARFLQSIYEKWQINHSMIDDAEELRIQGDIHNNIISIIPISSTLSTSHKMEMKSKKDHKESKLIGNPINIMIVGNGDLENISDSTGMITDYILRNFWKHIDINQKIITTVNGKEEKFFLYLPSKWFLPQNCELCFPENPSDETVLFETDKVSVTPSLIFDFPALKQRTSQAEKIHFGEWEGQDEDHQSVIFTQEMLTYGHMIREHNHYLYYIETTKFLKRNEFALDNWLKRIKNKLIENDLTLFNSEVILISPTRFTNAIFVNRVNEVIFGDMATLFHYDQDEDHIQNLKSFFEDDIKKAKVFFVDEAMCGGTTFEKINNFVKYVRSRRGVDGVFVLINTLMQDKYEVFINELGNELFFAFIDLEVPVMIGPTRSCHLCSEKMKYEKMLDETFLDSIRILIRAKIMKLEPKTYGDKVGKGKNADYLKRLEYLYKIYRSFSDDKIKPEIEQIFKGNEPLEELCGVAQIPFLPQLTITNKVDLIKVLSNPYLVYHKEIRKYIFKFVISELEQTTKNLLEVKGRDLNKGDLDIYRYLKFLLKRAAALRANYIIREEVLQKIFSVYQILENKLNEEEKKQNKKDLFTLNQTDKDKFRFNLHEFVDYYMVAIKEVCFYNDSKSLKLEETLDHLQHSGIKDATFLLLTQSLRIENASIPYRFLKSIEKKIEVIELNFTEKNYVSDINKLSKKIIAFCQNDPYRSDPLRSFLGFRKDNKEGQEIELFLETNKPFKTKILPMILLKAFFLHKKWEEEGKNPEMDYILFCLCEILDIDLSTGGAFFVGRYMKQEHLFMIGNIGQKKDIDSVNWENSFTSKIFSGYRRFSKSLPLTYVQILKQEGSLYTHYGEEIEKSEFSDIYQLKDMNSILFWRLADDDLDSTARGVIVFYNTGATLIPPKDLRYAMILKNDIFGFIEKNYENYSRKLYEEKIRQLEELEALNDVIAKITSAARLGEIYQAIQETKINIRTIDEICLLTQNDGKYEPNIPCCKKKTEECEKCKKQNLSLIQSGKTDEPYQTYYCPDIEKDSIWKEILMGGIKTKLIVPLVFDQKLLGVLELGSGTRDAFSSYEQKLLSSLGSQVAIAINNKSNQEKQGEIYKDISHSLGTYLTTMRAYTQRLIDDKVKDEIKKKEYLKMLYGDVFALTNSVDEIFSLANMEYWSSDSISENVEIMGLIITLAGKNKFLFEEKHLKLTIDGTNEEIFVKGDSKKLEDAFQSLLNNAIKFSDVNKKINIQVLTQAAHVFVKIKDEGYGIHPDDLDRIFEKYERGRNAKELKITGTGIGLAAVKNIIEKHSGTISVESELGKGSIFTVKLPLLIFKRESINRY